MSDISQGKGTGLIVAAVVGAAVGAGIALLFAPSSGRETRTWLAQRARELKDRTMTAYEQGRDATLRAARELGSDIDDPTTNSDRPAHTPRAEAATLRG